MILVPKRKMKTGSPIDRTIETIIDHTEEKVSSQIKIGQIALGDSGFFTHRLKIPVGTDMYD